MRQDATKRPEETPQIVTSTYVRDEGIQRLQGTIWHGSRRLHKVNKEWAWLKRKSAMLDEEINKMKIGIAQVGHTNLQRREPSLVGSTLVLERAMTLLS